MTGNPCAGKIASQSDLLICVGTRMTDFSTGSQSAFQHPDVKFINVNVGSHDAYKQGAVPVLADARAGLEALTRAAKAAGVRPQEGYVQEIARVKQEWRSQVQNEVYQQVEGEL